MDIPKFTTYWTISGQQYTNIDEVERLVVAGAVAAEVSASKQAEDWHRQQLLEAWYKQALARYDKIVAAQHHRQTPEGRQEAAVRHARMNPGGLVSGASDPAYDELDRYSPGATDAFKQ